MVQKLKELCKQKGVSFIQFERETGLGEHTVAKWEKHAPSVKKVQIAADYFGVSVSYLLGETKNPTTEDGDGDMADLLQALRERPEMKMLFHAGMKATPETVRQTAKFLEGLAKGDSD